MTDVHGLKIEKTTGGNYDEKLGMIEYFKKFLENYKKYPNNHDRIVDETIGYFVDRPDFRVTYLGKGDGATEVVRKSETEAKQTGQKFDPDIKASKDNGNGKHKKFNITVPSDEPDSTARYVSDMIANLGGVDTAENQQYLTGLLLMRKCR